MSCCGRTRSNCEQGVGETSPAQDALSCCSSQGLCSGWLCALGITRQHGQSQMLKDATDPAEQGQVPGDRIWGKRCAETPKDTVCKWVQTSPQGKDPMETQVPSLPRVQSWIQTSQGAVTPNLNWQAGQLQPAILDEPLTNGSLRMTNGESQGKPQPWGPVPFDSSLLWVSSGREGTALPGPAPTWGSHSGMPALLPPASLVRVLRGQLSPAMQVTARSQLAR